MLKRVIAGVLSLTVLGAGGAAVVHQTTQEASAETPAAEPVQGEEAAVVAAVDPAAQADVQAAAIGDTAVEQAAQPAASEPWTDTGMIMTVDDYGFTMQLADGSEIYVELGPPTYWQAQGVALAAGDVVNVAGSTTEGMYHASVVTLSDGQQLAVRDTTTGQPLWSGGAQNRNGAANGSTNANGLQDGQQAPQPQAQVDEWVTVTGTITAINRSQITIQTTEGESITFQAGQPSFFESQGVTLTAGDEVEVLGFWQGTTFNAGEITLTATGERVMLRDPNGRPLWAGPGQEQGGQGGGQGGQGGQGGGQGRQGGSQGNGGQGGGQGQGGSGRQYRGGQ